MEESEADSAGGSCSWSPPLNKCAMMSAWGRIKVKSDCNENNFLLRKWHTADSIVMLISKLPFWVVSTVWWWATIIILYNCGFLHAVFPLTLSWSPVIIRHYSFHMKINIDKVMPDLIPTETLIMKRSHSNFRRHLLNRYNIYHASVYASYLFYFYTSGDWKVGKNGSLFLIEMISWNTVVFWWK